jgi:hypothetical protein
MESALDCISERCHGTWLDTYRSHVQSQVAKSAVLGYFC